MAEASRSNGFPSVVRASHPSPTVTAVRPGASLVSDTLPPLVRLTATTTPSRWHRGRGASGHGGGRREGAATTVLRPGRPAAVADRDGSDDDHVRQPFGNHREALLDQLPGRSGVLLDPVAGLPGPAADLCRTHLA